LIALGVAARASAAISTERERHTWDLLLITPLTPRELLRGKLWGSIDAFAPYLKAFVVPALILAALNGLAAFAIVGLGWLIAWVLAYFMAAAGIYCSVRSETSWRSLLGVLAFSSWSVFVRFALVGFPIGLIATIFLMLPFGGFLGWPALGFVGTSIFVLFSGAITAAQLFGQAEYLVEQAQAWFEAYDRRL
jgi:hypothetical protein